MSESASTLEPAAPKRVPETMRDARFGLLARGLHWLMAILVVAMLFLGAAMVGTIGHYALLLTLHKTVGVAILVLAVIRIGNRLRRTAPASPPLGRIERLVASGSEVLMYVLFTLQPVVGWALVSASGVPVRIAGDLRLPAIAPTDAHLYAELRSMHSWLAYALLAVFTAHMCAVLAHATLLRDGMLRRML